MAEHVLCDGREKTTRGIGASVADAWEAAGREMPPGASILDRREVTQPGMTTVVVEAHDEGEARTRLATQVPEGAQLGKVSLDRPATKGVLGFGRRPSAFRADVIEPAIVQIRWHLPVRISAEFGDVATARQDRAARWRQEGDAFVNCAYCSRPYLRREIPVISKEEFRGSRECLDHAIKRELQSVLGENYMLVPSTFTSRDAESAVLRFLDGAPSMLAICDQCLEYRIPDNASARALIVRPEGPPDERPVD